MNSLQKLERLGGWRERALSMLPEYHRAFMRLMVNGLSGKLTYNSDGLATTHNCDFKRDQKFKHCFDDAVRLNLHVSKNIHWRAHTLCWAAWHALKLKGDFVECGVYRGFLSKVVMDYVDFSKQGRKFYLMDTYEGLVEGHITGAERLRGVKGGEYEPSYDFVRKIFSSYKNVEIIKGAIPGTLPMASSSSVAYLHIDMNCSLPEIAAAEYFWGKMPIGGIMVLDDYGFSGHEEQKKAFDLFASLKGVRILTLPTGQGMLIKPYAGDAQ